MNLQENQLLRDFLTRLTQAQAGARDPEVEMMINGAVAQQPDATYLLVQRTLLLERALQQAKAQLASLQERSGSSFGGGDPWSQAPSGAMGNAPAQAPAPQPPSAQPAAPASGGWRGLLGNAATTAAGVAGGALLFEGVESLFGHHGGSFLGGGAGAEPVENVTVNNFASDDDSRGSAGAEDSGADSDNSGFDDDSSWT